jgi:hypothetical protein
MADYEERFVVFLDILGFSRLVKESAPPSPRISVEQLREALTVPDPAGADMVVIGRIGDVSLCRHRMSHFSDCIVASTDPTEAGLMYLILHIQKIAFRLLRLRFLCRGGLVKGLLHHDGVAVFGPYHIEKCVAKHPRVVLDDAIARWSYQLAEPVGRIMRARIRRHEDGHHAVHVLQSLTTAMSADNGPGPEYTRMCHDIANLLDTEIARLHDNPDDRKKVEWFKNHFHDLVRPIR